MKNRADLNLLISEARRSKVSAQFLLGLEYYEDKEMLKFDLPSVSPPGPSPERRFFLGVSWTNYKCAYYIFFPLSSFLFVFRRTGRLHSARSGTALDCGEHLFPYSQAVREIAMHSFVEHNPLWILRSYEAKTKVALPKDRSTPLAPPPTSERVTSSPSSTSEHIVRNHPLLL